MLKITGQLFRATKGPKEATLQVLAMQGPRGLRDPDPTPLAAWQRGEGNVGLSRPLPAPVPTLRASVPPQAPFLLEPAAGFSLLTLAHSGASNHGAEGEWAAKGASGTAQACSDQPWKPLPAPVEDTTGCWF